MCIRDSWSVVRRFLGRGYEPEDLFQIGSIGLMKAIDGFDTSFEVRFSTYAIPKITGEIKRFIRDDGMIKVSRTLKGNGWKAAQASEHLKQQLGRDATLEAVSYTHLPRLFSRYTLRYRVDTWRSSPVIST